MRPQKFRGNVFVANFPLGFTDAQLAQVFDQYGMVMGACLARDHATGAVKGHGLVDIAPAAAAARAIAALNGTEIGGRRIEVRMADPNMALSIPVPPNAGGEAGGGYDAGGHRGGGHGGGGPEFGEPGAAPRPPRRAPVQVEVRRSRRPVR